MKIIFDDDQKTGFVVIPTSDRKIISQFIDYETGYLIVNETNNLDSLDTGVYCTVIDSRTGEVKDVETRSQQIDATEKEIILGEDGLKIVMHRTIDQQTGQEIKHEKLIDISTQKEISSRISLAFHPQLRETIVETYYKHKGQQKADEKFWTEEYPRMSLDEKKHYWWEYIYQYMRMRGELGYDMLGVFSRESYREWREHEPEIDTILDDIIAMLPMIEDEGEIRDKVNERLGRR